MGTKWTSIMPECMVQELVWLSPLDTNLIGMKFILICVLYSIYQLD